jgi:plastocyanin
MGIAPSPTALTARGRRAYGQRMSSIRLAASLALATAAVAGLAGCGGDDNTKTASANAPAPASKAKPASTATGITIDNFTFKPSTLTVSGGRVKATNSDSTAHTVTADDGKSFDTGSIDPGASATLSVAKPGTYKYHCSIHSFMHGTLVVK